jgi:outer membrane lipoprotein
VKKIKYRIMVSLLIAAIASSTSCARPFPSAILDRVDKHISFADLSKNPDNYKGKWVMLAGIIVLTRTEKDGSTSMEIAQKPADSNGRPLQTDETGGRFIAVSKQFLDPVIYQRGREISVVGEVIGETSKPLGEMIYRYPLLTVEALHLWEPSYGPGYSVGIGVGVFHGY